MNAQLYDHIISKDDVRCQAFAILLAICMVIGKRDVRIARCYVSRNGMGVYILWNPQGNDRPVPNKKSLSGYDPTGDALRKCELTDA